MLSRESIVKVYKNTRKDPLSSGGCTNDVILNHSVEFSALRTRVTYILQVRANYQD